MNEQEQTQLERFMQTRAGRFPYPPTPDLASAVSQKLAPPARQTTINRRRLAGAITILLLLLSLAALSVPPVRAALFEFFQIGAIRVFVGDAPADESGSPPPLATSIPFPLNLSGETTLAAIREETDIPIDLPTYPAGLGPPDHVFLQEVGVPVVILAWRDPGTSEEIDMSLFIIDNTVLPLGTKFEVQESMETTVNDRPALWVSGGHILQFEHPNGRIDLEMTRLVGSHTLIWQANGVTYRLEADLPLAELVKIAESLPVSGN